MVAKKGSHFAHSHCIKQSKGFASNNNRIFIEQQTKQNKTKQTNKTKKKQKSNITQTIYTFITTSDNR
jgi:hypothetical protein